MYANPFNFPARPKSCALLPLPLPLPLVLLLLLFCFFCILIMHVLLVWRHQHIVWILSNKQQQSGPTYSQLSLSLSVLWNRGKCSKRVWSPRANLETAKIVRPNVRRRCFSKHFIAQLTPAESEMFAVILVVISLYSGYRVKSSWARPNGALLAVWIG